MRVIAPLAVVGLAAALRFWGLFQGLPFVMSRPDEVEMLRQTAGFPSGDLNPRWFVYPNLFFWIAWLWLEGVLALRRLVADVPSYADMLGTQMATLIAYGRVLSALAGTATVAVVYAIGRRLGGTMLGLMAATLLATNFLHVRDSHALKSEVYLTLAVPLCLALLTRWVHTASARDARRAGIATGIAMGLKYPAVLLVVTGLHADRLAQRRRGAPWRPLPSALFLRFGLATVVTFVCVSPFLLLDFERLQTTFNDLVRLAYDPARSATPAAQHVAWHVDLRSWLAKRALPHHVWVSLRWGCGLAAALLLPWACVTAWRQGRQEPFWRLTVGFVVVFSTVIGLSIVPMARYFTPLTPLVALLVANLLLDWARRLGASTRGARAAYAVLLVAVVAAEPFSRAVAHDLVASRTDTRVLATRWMDAHLPQDAVVAVLGSTFFPIADPDVPPPRRRVTIPWTQTQFGRDGITHVVVHEHQLNFSRPIPAQMAALGPRLTPLAEFSPYRGTPAGWFEPYDAYYIPFHGYAGVERPGPVVRIYALAPLPPEPPA